jgi:hypothetical protein
VDEGSGRPGSSACWYCRCTGVALVPCCAHHPGRLVCADVAVCRDVLLEDLRAAQAAREAERRRAVTGRPPLGAKITPVMQAQMDAYKTCRDGGMGPFEAQHHLGWPDYRRIKFERWYRRQAGLPPRQRGIDRDWRTTP